MSISPTFSCSTNPTSSLTPSFSSEKPNSKTQNIQNQITSLISIELYHLDIDEIASNYNTLYPEQTPSQSDFIKSLCKTISNVKKSTISSVSSFLSDNAKSIKANENYSSALNSILMEVKTYTKLSKIKFKQINESFQLLNLNLNSLSEYVKLGKISYALDKIGKIDEIKNTFQNTTFSLEEQQNKFYDNIQLIFQKNKIELSLNTNNNYQNINPTNNVSIFKAKSFLSHYSTNHKRNNSKLNGSGDYSVHIRQFSANKKNILNNSIINETNYLSHSIDNVKKIKKNLSPLTFSNQNNTITNSNELVSKNKNENVSLYKKKNKEYLATIERLKVSLKNETEAKNALHSEISKLKQQILISYSSSNTKSSNKAQIAQKEIQLNSLSSKITKVIEMVVSFSYSMNTLRDSLFKKKSNVIDPKNDYNKLRTKLVQISNDLINAGKNISKYYDSVEESLNQSTSNNSNMENSFNTKPSTNKTELYETLLRQNTELKEENNELREHNQQLTNKIITFRNDDVKKCEKNVFNTITSEHDNYDKVVEENKKLKSQLSSMMLLNNNNKNENCKQDENFTNENFALKKELFDIKKKTLNEINELKSTISKQKDEILYLQSTKENKDECDFKLLKEQYEKNLSEIKETYTTIVNDKNQSIEKLTKDNITLNTEINELKEKVANFETEYRKQKIVYESSISNLKNEKISLELKLKNVTNDSSGNVVNNDNNEYEDKIKKLNAFIENQKIQIKHLNEIIISKDKIFETINSNSPNATNSDTIEQLQNKLLEDSRTINKLKQEINEKNNQITLITDNHQNDLNELNTSIILLKSKIAKLQEENVSLSYSQRGQA